MAGTPWSASLGGVTLAVRLTPKGRRQFETMAQEHEGWILELFGGLDAKTVQQLYQQLGQLRVHLVRNEQADEDA